jgi:hypothetical protein
MAEGEPAMPSALVIRLCVPFVDSRAEERGETIGESGIGGVLYECGGAKQRFGGVTFEQAVVGLGASFCGIGIVTDDRGAGHVRKGTRKTADQLRCADGVKIAEVDLSHGRQLLRVVLVLVLRHLYSYPAFFIDGLDAAVGGQREGSTGVVYRHVNCARRRARHPVGVQVFQFALEDAARLRHHVERDILTRAVAVSCGPGRACGARLDELEFGGDHLQEILVGGTNVAEEMNPEQSTVSTMGSPEWPG